MLIAIIISTLALLALAARGGASPAATQAELHTPAPESAAFLSQGKAHRELGEYEKAVEAYTEAIRLDPTEADAYYNRSNAYRNLGNQ
ncbi:MAG: Tetratricopeptide (TPR) repeat [Chloroflexi bacterium]|jgi:tetratricopeptide (TPR) repeat protein|nr:MAG: Tetratricopeptide (TPR) repeat [Chloroflexota bacterium]